MSQKLFLIDDYLLFIVVVVVGGGGGAILVFVVNVVVTEFNVVISAVAVNVFHLAVVPLVLLIVAAVASDFEIDNGDSAVAW